MRWSDLLRMSVSSLRRRKLRTFLTVLGVVIGTASIVVMISLGLGLQESMYKEVEQNGGTTSITDMLKIGSALFTWATFFNSLITSSVMYFCDSSSSEDIPE